MSVRELRMVVSSDVAELARVRGFVDLAVTALGTHVNRADLAVASTELVANAMALDAGDVTICVAPGPGHAVRIQVTDGGSGRPEVVDREAWDPAGHRGLQIVDQIAADWGVRELPMGKVVWCDLAAVPSSVGAGSLAER